MGAIIQDRSQTFSIIMENIFDLNKSKDLKRISAIREWCQHNCNHSYKIRSSLFEWIVSFSSKYDAMAFKLRWMGDE
jgi:hypothetical protein